MICCGKQRSTVREVRSLPSPMTMLKVDPATVVDTLKPKWSPVQYITHPISSKESIFRQPPSDEVDAAWDRITDIGVLVLSAEDVTQMGKDPSNVVKAPESWGQGSDAHLAHLDGIHLLHCLNSMRQSLHSNFDRYHPNGISKVYASHLSHCQEALVKHLMCQPSVELITYNWVERQDHPFPDFDNTRKCWDFEQLLDWQEQHRVQTMSQEKWKVLRKPVNVTPLPVPLLMLEAYNVTREEAEAMPL
jgi:hypothetical protein